MNISLLIILHKRNLSNWISETRIQWLYIKTTTGYQRCNNTNLLKIRQTLFL